MMIEISGQEKKIEAFIEAVRSYGILEVARTGRIALVRGTRHLDEDRNGLATGPETAPPEDDEPTVQGHSEL